MSSARFLAALFAVCSTLSSEANAVDSKALTADIALASGLVALGAAAFVYWGTTTQPKSALTVAPRPNGANATMAWVF
jgi:hypothetical protein